MMILITRLQEMFCTTFELLSAFDVRLERNTMTRITLADTVSVRPAMRGRGFVSQIIENENDLYYHTYHQVKWIHDVFMSYNHV
jgi:hypothetical protein